MAGFVGDSKKTGVVEEVEMFDTKLSTVPTEVLRSDSEDNYGVPFEEPQSSMTTTMWLACAALCVCYTTALQQHMCTSSIVKHIDAALGSFALQS
jgi:hypothetical protein